MTPCRSIGVPAERKDGERRVALTPSGVGLLTAAGIEVRLEQGAGERAGYPDDSYRARGATIVESAEEVWAAELVVKVKEPLPSEWGYFRQGLVLFAYLHLAACPDLAAALQHAGVEAHAFETVTDGDGLPLLAPMSEIAGRAAAIVGAARLSDSLGTLVGGAAGVPPARVVVVGLGVAGTMAARGLRGMDADVLGVDVDLGRLARAHASGTVNGTLASAPDDVSEAVADADLVVGAALVPGARAPMVVDREAVAAMRPGSVVLDLAIDQGGCLATSRPTSLSDPVFVEAGVTHYCVTNVPGLYPRTASRALSAALAPRTLRLAIDRSHPLLQGSLNVADGAITHAAVADALASLR